MTDFNRILTEIQTGEAEAAAGAAIEHASQTAQRAEAIRYARRRFDDAGLGTYLRQQAEAMHAAHYWARVFDTDLSDRVQTSIEFVPAPHVAYEKQISGPNTVTLHIVSWPDGSVKAQIYTGYSNNRVQLPPAAIDSLSLEDVRQWFARYVEYAMAFQKDR